MLLNKANSSDHAQSALRPAPGSSRSALLVGYKHSCLRVIRWRKIVKRHVDILAFGAAIFYKYLRDLFGDSSLLRL